MTQTALTERLNNKQAFDSLLTDAIEQPELITGLLALMQTGRGSLKFKAEKVIRAVSERQPALLLPHFDLLVSLTKSSNSFIKWGAIITLSNLFQSDIGHHYEAYLAEYLGLIHAEDMITAGNAVGNMWKVVRAYPEREQEITSLLLSVPEIVYKHKGEPSPECNRVVCGHLLDCFDKYYETSGLKQEILAFAEQQLNSSRPGVAKKAAAFLKRHRKP